jgi:hypothetical protein
MQPRMVKISEAMKQIEKAMEELEKQLGVERKRAEEESQKDTVKGGQGVLTQG